MPTRLFDSTYELRLSLRRLIGDPMRSGISVIAFALGIGLTASMFSIAYSILFRGTPFGDQDELFAVERSYPGSSRRVGIMSYADYLDLEAEQGSFVSLGAWSGTGFDLADDENRPERVYGARLSHSFLDVLEVSPRIGRAFTPADMGPQGRVVLLSDRLWRNRYGADPNVVGRSIRMDAESWAVIGVMTPGFHFPGNQDLWVPMPHEPSALARDEAYVTVMGRLAEGAAPTVARAELETIFARLTREFGEGEAPPAVALVPLVQSFLGEGDAALLWAMMLSSLLVLAIACVNVTNLLTAVAADRTGDVAVCTVLGASRVRVLGQLLLDAVLLALVGGALGIGIALLFVGWFERQLVGRAPAWMQFHIDLPILLFVLGVSLLAALIAGLTPALRSARVSLREVIQDESRGASSRGLGRLSQAMVVATMSLAYPLLVGAGLLIASFGAWKQDLPFEGDDLLVAQLGLPSRYFSDAEARFAFVDEFATWAEGRAGIESVTWADVVPSLGVGTGSIAFEGEVYERDEDHPRARLAAVRPGFFETIGVQPTRGRTFDAQDRTGPPVAIANEPFVARHFPGTDPVGRRLQLRADSLWRTIVGVVPDLRLNGTDRDTPEGLYLPTPPIDATFGYFLVRTTSDPAAAAPVVRRGVAEIAPEVPIRALETLDDRVEQAYWIINVVGPIFTMFGLAALFLASVGLFGVVAHSVSRRTREIGVRMALGATRGSVLATITRGGLGQALLGVVLGSGLALAGSRLLASALFGVRPGDPLVMAIVGGVLVGSVLLATVVPALRALRLSPVDALRGP